MKPRITNHLVLLALVLLAAGCRGRPAVPPPAPVASGPLAVAVNLSTNELRVGDGFKAVISVDHPAAGRIQWPAVAQGKDVVVRDQKVSTQPLAPGRARTTAEYSLTSFRVGAHLVATGWVSCAMAGQEELRQPVPRTSFSVVSVLGDKPEALRDIAGIAAWPGRVPRWVGVLALVAALAAIAAWVAARLVRRRSARVVAPPPPRPHEIAWQALARLKTRGWIESGAVEPFYVELSGIVRFYLEGRFRLRAPERTTEEFIREAANARVITPPHQQLVRQFLEQCDLVKFARHRPAADDMRGGLAAAETLVRETQPQPTPPPAGPVVEAAP